MNLDVRTVPANMLSEYDRLKWIVHYLHFKEMRYERNEIDRSSLNMDINNFLRRMNK